MEAEQQGGSRGHSRPSKLTADLAVAIRKQRADGRMSSDIAADFGVSQSLVCQIATGKLWAHAGGPLTRLYVPKNASLEDRFWPNVDDSGGPEACWPWTGRRAPEGYGQFCMGDRNVTASRASLEIALGRPLAEGMKACHRCDNPPCVNPDHLFEGSGLDNVLDCVAKGRTARKLSDDQVRDIRSLGQGAWGERVKIAEQYGITPQHCGRIIRGVARKHVALLAGRSPGASS